MAEKDVLKVALVGGGPGGLAVLKMFESDIFTQFRARVIGVADINPKAPGFIYAKQKGLFTTTDYKDLYRIPDLYLIIELTGRDDVLHEIARTKPVHIQLVDHVTARLFWDIFQIEEKRKQALEALKQANIFWENIFNCMQNYILVIDEEHNIITANKAVLEKTGLCKEEIKKRKCYEIAEEIFFCKPCTMQGPCPLRDVFTNKQPISRLYTIKKDNTGKYIEVTLYPLNLKTKPAQAVVIQRDITEFMVCSFALEETEKKFYSLFETARDAIIILDDNLHIHQANRAAAKVFGYHQDELIHLDIKTLIPAEEKAFYAYFKETKEEPITVTGIKKNGTKFPVRASVAPFSFKGKHFFTLIMRDQTRRKEMEERLLQAEKLATVGQTASYLMHEIKNPLIVIGGFAQQLIRNIEGPAQKKLEVILEEVKRLEKLLSDVRDFTKPIKLEKKIVNINQLIKETVSLFDDTAKAQNITVEVELDNRLSPISVDPELLKQVLINIIKNAIEAMPKGGRLKVTSAINGDFVRIEIADTGCGIPAEKLKDIFNPFFTTKKKGTGLGLTISYRIIKDHGGNIKIKSEVNKGTTCTIFLPLNR